MADYYVYILANKSKNVLYTGVTNNLRRRIAEHKSHTVPGFTDRYNVEHLVYFEHFVDPNVAIAREKQIKAGSRATKIRLIKSVNPGLDELEVEHKR